MIWELKGQMATLSFTTLENLNLYLQKSLCICKNLSVFVNSCSQLWCVTTNWKLIPFAFKVHKPFESIKCHLKSILKLFVHTVDNKYLVKHLGPHWKLRIPIPALLTYDLHGLHVKNYYKV